MTNAASRSTLASAFDGVITVGLIVAAALGVASWIDPNHHEPWHAFHGQLWMSIAACLAATWLLTATWRSGRRALSAPYPAIAVMAVGLVPWIQWLAGIVYFGGDAWMACLYLTGAGATIAVGYAWAARSGLGEVVTAVCGIVVAAGLMSVWIGLCQLWELTYFGHFGVPTRPDGRVAANLSQPNQLSIMMVMAMAASVWLHVCRHVSVVTLFLLVAMFAMTLALTASRAGAVALLMTTAWMVLAHRSRQRPLGAWPPAVVALACAAGFGAALVQSQLIAAVDADAVTTRSLDSMSTAGHRPTHWLSILDAALRRPWTGYGWGQVFVAQYEVAPAHQATHELISSSHNVVLDLMATMGAVPGFALFAALAVWIVWLVWRARSRESWMAVALMLPVAFYAMVEFPQEYTYFLLPVCALLGGLQADGPRTPRLVLRVPLALAAGVVVLFVGALSLTVRDYLALESALRIVRFEQARVGKRPQQAPDPVLVLTQVDTFLRFIDTPDADGMTREQLHHFGRVARRYPNWTTLSRWAAALARNGDPQGASGVLSRICKTHSASDCARARKQWLARSAAIPALARVPWPDTSTR